MAAKRKSAAFNQSQLEIFDHFVQELHGHLASYL
jgi:hypothetical protein